MVTLGKGRKIMLDSDAIKQIQKTIEILNNLNDNEKDLVLNDINSKLEPFKNDGTIKKKPKKKAAFRMEKATIQLDKYSRVSSCPLCGSTDSKSIIKNGKDNKGHQRYFCKSCNKTFNTTTNSITHCSKKSDKYWNILIGGILENKTYKAIADETDASISTVYTHALRVMEQVVNTSKSQLLEGSVESDETYFLPNFKGDKKICKYNFNGIPKITYRKTDHELYDIPTASEIKYRQKQGLGLRGLSKDKICYCTAITKDYTFCGGPVKRGNIDEKSLSKALLMNLSPKTLFIGDSSRANKTFVGKYNIKHELVVSDKNSRNGEYNLQKVNYLHSLLKEIMKSNRSFSTKHSEKYISFLAWKLKNKEFTKEEQISLLKNMMLDNKKSLTWKEVRTTSFPICVKIKSGNLHNHICHE
jgi:transposase-like protein